MSWVRTPPRPPYKEYMSSEKGLGWRPDVPDIRDEKFSFRTALKNELLLPAEIPVRNIVQWRYNNKTNKACSEYPVHNQLNTSSCTGNSTDTMISLLSGWTPRSRLMLYYNGRLAIGETNVDNGAYIRDVIKGAASVGVSSETLWPFQVDKVTTKPSRSAYFSAGRHKLYSYHRLQTRQDFLSCLAQGFPFVIGFMVYSDFVTQDGVVDKYGILNCPTDGQSDYGGHAVCVIGYDNDFHNSEWGKEALAAGINVPKSVYIVRNSWGADWGRKGNFAVDCNYFENTNLADDAWTVRLRK